MAGATADLFRRAGVIELAKASATYTPSSSDDAVAVRQQVTQLVEAEMQVAADQGQDDSYQALHDVRTAVVQDLAARAADLASMVQVATPHSVPALFLAQSALQGCQAGLTSWWPRQPDTSRVHAAVV